MKARAQLLGAELRWTRNAGAAHGCQVRLTLNASPPPATGAEVIPLRPKAQPTPTRPAGEAIDELNHREHT